MPVTDLLAGSSTKVLDTHNQVQTVSHRDTGDGGGSECSHGHHHSHFNSGENRRKRSKYSLALNMVNMQ